MGRQKGSKNKLSKTELNKAELKKRKAEKKESVGEQDEVVIKSLIRKRTYTCSCGCHVTLNGEIGKQKMKDGFELCSTCAGK